MNKHIVTIGLLVIIIAALFWLSNVGNDRTPAPIPTRIISKSQTVTYKITGSNNKLASLTYTNQTGGTEQMKVLIPWEKKFKLSNPEFVYLSAQLDGGSDFLRIQCEILVDGVSVQKSNSSGGFSIATCSGSVP